MITQEDTRISDLAFTVQKRAVLYARKSNNDEIGGLREQLVRCGEYALEKGYEIVAEIEEDDVKGESIYDPGINEALRMARSGLFDILVIRHVDRYSRKATRALDLEVEFFKHNVSIEYVDSPELNGLPQEGFGSDIVRYILYKKAEEDKKETIKKLYNARASKVKAHKSVMTFGRPPYGYTQIRTVNDAGIEIFALVVLESEAYWVRKIYEWYVQGDLSIRAIQRKLKAKHVPRPSVGKPSTGGRVNDKSSDFNWPHNSVSEILKRKVYTGIYEYGKSKRAKRKNSIIRSHLIEEPIVVEVPPIISQELFDAAQAKIQSNKRKTVKTTKHNFLFRSRVVCGECDNTVCRCQASNHSDWKVYRCTTSARGKGDPANFRTCDLPPFKRDVIDKTVWAWLCETFNNKDKLKLGYENFKRNQGDKLQPLLDELARIERKIEACNQQLLEQATALGRLQSVDSTHAVTALQKEIKKVERMIDDYAKDKAEIVLKLEKAKTAKAIITDFDGFVDTIRDSLEKADGNFSAMEHIVDLLDVQVILSMGDDGPQFTPRCILRPDNNDAISCTTPWSE